VTAAPDAAPHSSRPSPVLRVPAQGFRGLAGAARRDITPPVGIRNRMWGAALTDVSDGVHRPLLLEALCFATSDRKEQVLLLTLDACTWGNASDWFRFRDAVVAGTRLPAERILANLSHTPSGCTMALAQRELPGGEYIPAFLESLYEAAVSAANEAIAALTPATLEWRRGSSDMAGNRELDLAGRALTGFNPLKAADPTVLVGRVSSTSGESIATIVNYACHGTTLGAANSKLSPDFVGAMRETVEAVTGTPVLFLQGASGDTSPREQYSGDLALADRHGRALGHAVLSTLETMPEPGMDLEFKEAVESGAPLAVWGPTPTELSEELAVAHRVVPLPLRRLGTIEELKEQWSDILPQSLDERLRRWRGIYAELPAAYGEQYGDEATRPATVPHDVWVVKLGTSFVVGQPAEAYNWYQTTIRERVPEFPVAVLNLTNGPNPGYVADGDAYCRGAYQSWQTLLADGALQQLADATVEVIESL
jgi:hypothetical protein